jgi:triacylglycerol lipase
MIRVLAALLLALVVGSVVFNAVAYGGAAWAGRRRAPPCAFDEEERAAWPARALAWLRVFLVECVATACLALPAPPARRQPGLPPGEALPRPVVLVPGYQQHTGSLGWLRRRLRRDGWPTVHTVWALRVDIDRRAARLGEAIERIRREVSAQKVDIVAHGNGGLVARAYVCARGGTCGVGQLITLGTPHQGTTAWWLGPGPTRALRPGSAFLRRLAADDPVPVLTDCTSIYSIDDALVVPSTAAYYPGAFNVEVRRLGHMSLLLSRRVYELVRENLTASEPVRQGFPRECSG